MGGTGVAFSDDSLSAYWNPANLAFQKGWDVQMPVTANGEIVSLAVEKLSDLLQRSADMDDLLEQYVDCSSDCSSDPLSEEDTEDIVGLLYDLSRFGKEAESVHVDIKASRRLISPASLAKTSGFPIEPALSDLVRIKPSLFGPGDIVGQLIEERPGLLGHDQTVLILSLHEAFLDRMLQKGQQTIIKALYIQQTAGLLMNAQLRPGHDLQGLLECPDPTGQSDEGI